MTGFNSIEIFNYFLELILIFLFLPVMIITHILILIKPRKFPGFKQLSGIILSNRILYNYKSLALKFSMYNLKSLQYGKLDHKYFNDELTFTGKIIRSMGSGELPQPFHCPMGDMKLIRPRTLILKDYVYIKDHYPEVYDLPDKINSRSGITGLCLINRNVESNIKSFISQFLYNEKASNLLLYIKILLKNFLIVIQCKHDEAISGNRLTVNFALIF